MKALILGINGQDGSYLAEYLLEKGYEVHGLIRRTAIDNLINLKNIKKDIELHYGDLSDSISLQNIISTVKPYEIYNEADQDHAGISYKIPAYNYDVTGAAVGRLLEIIRTTNDKIKYFQPVTSNMYGKVNETPQNEETPFNPQNPYSCAKIFAYYLCQMYRQTYHMHISVGIFFNHESERRSEDYVTRKITKAIARIKSGKQDKLYLGDLSASIDWGHSKEYMEAAWSIMQLPYSDNFIIGTGETHTVKEFVDVAFAYAGLDSSKYVESSNSLLRPNKNDLLVADITKIRKAINFDPKIKFNELIKLMVDNDLKHTN